MKILIDTHIFLWSLAEPARLTSEQRAEIETMANLVFVSTISVTELMIKHSLGKIDINFDPIEMIEQTGFQHLNYSASDAMLLKDLPFHHKDPFDRMLIAQAVNQKLKLMSSDQKFALYDCDLIV